MIESLNFITAAAYIAGFLVAFAAFADWIFLCIGRTLNFKCTLLESSLDFLLGKCLYRLMLAQFALTTFILAAALKG